MPILSDKWIIEQATNGRLIAPFQEGIKRPGFISFGVTSYGYDITLADEYDIFSPYPSVIDPKAFDPELLTRHTGETFLIPPHSYILGRSVEWFEMPKNVTGIVMGKSTYARSGLIVNTTPLEAGWKGHITLELCNPTSSHLKVYANEGIGQVLFFEGNEPCLVDYEKKGGKYQGQSGITHPKVD